jgi:hypothetical protein
VAQIVVMAAGLSVQQQEAVAWVLALWLVAAASMLMHQTPSLAVGAQAEVWAGVAWLCSREA